MLVKTMNLDEKRFLRELGQRVREQRQARALSQADLGRLCSLHRTFIGSIERGERNVSILNLRVVAKTLRISLAELLKESEKHR
jgi:transcriptional regulator with XRE-family HTH domain